MRAAVTTRKELHLLCAGCVPSNVLSPLCELAYFILPTTQEVGTSAIPVPQMNSSGKNSQIIWPGSHSWHVAEPGLEPSHQTPEPKLSHQIGGLDYLSRGHLYHRDG